MDQKVSARDKVPAPNRDDTHPSIAAGHNDAPLTRTLRRPAELEVMLTPVQILREARDYIRANKAILILPVVVFIAVIGVVVFLLSRSPAAPFIYN
jgi:hypothetical protein